MSASARHRAGSARQPDATAGSGSRLHVDWTRCDGRGLCTELLPELLDRDEWGYPLSRSGSDPAVPRALARDAADAVRSCPRQALRLLDR